MHVGLVDSVAPQLDHLVVDMSSSSSSSSSFPEQQLRRLARMRNERHFLLGCGTIAGRAITFDVSGSTGNVYTVRLDAITKRFRCSCPDHGNWAKRCNVECKHVCFVVYRVLRSQFDAEFFSRDRRVRDCLVERYRSRVQRLGQSLSIRQSAAASDGVDANGASTGHLADLVNDQYLNRYHGRSSSDDDTNIHGVDDDTLVAIGAFRVGSLKTSRKSGDDGDGDDDAECPICFEMLSDSSADGDGWLVCCGDRRHATHRECIDHWLRQNPTKDRCIYCRAPLAYATWFQSATPTASNSARKRKRNSDVTINPATGKPYVNLHR